MSGAPAANSRSLQNESVLHARLLGVPQFFVDGRPVDVRFRKSKGLLAYLCLNAGRRVSRARVCQLLWEDDDSHKAYASLRQTWFATRKALADAGYQGIESDRDWLRLQEACVTTDLGSIVSGLQSGSASVQELLDGVRLSDRLGEGLESVGETFFAWLRTERQIAFTRIHTALEALLETSPEHSPLRNDIARAMLNLDPTNELACRALMAERAAKGDIAGAIDAYNDLWRILDEEFDAEPSPETQSLLARIKLDRYTPKTLPPQSGILLHRGSNSRAVTTGQETPAYLERGPIIVAGDFETLSNSERSRRHTMVFRHDLLSRLIRFREWSVFDQLPPDGIDKADSVFVLSATLNDNDGQTDVSLSLKELANQRYVWSEYFTVGANELLDRQADILGRLALALNVHVSADRLSRLQVGENLTIDLYDRLLQAQELQYRWRREDADQAAEIYRSLIAERPFFAPAYSCLAQVINSRHILFPGEYRNERHLDFANHLGRTALRLDPLDSRAHLCSAWSAALMNEFDAAAESYKHAYQLNENDPWTSVSAAAGIGFCGDAEEARAMAIRALDMGLVASPSQWSYQVAIWFACGDYERAVEAFRRSQHGGFLGVEAWYVAALIRLRREAEAREQYSALIERIRRSWMGAVEPTQENIERWLLQCFPIGNPETRAHFVEGLRDAGMRASA